jgi:hypothetical protein
MDPYASYSKLAVSSEQASQQPVIGVERREDVSWKLEVDGRR